MSQRSRRLQCPFCGAYDIARMYLASLELDSCECGECGARWEEEHASGAYRGRAAGRSGAAPPAPGGRRAGGPDRARGAS